MWSLKADQRRAVVMLPGGVLPAEIAYKDLIQQLEPQTDVVAKELEIYSTDRPPTDYGLNVEVEGILRAADQANFERFHLLGYSAGGASSLAFAAAHPERLLSLALAEPAWDGAQGLSDAENAVWQEFDRIMELPEDQRLPAFIRNQLRPGITPPPPPPGPSPPWMLSRPAALAVFVRVFRTSQLDRDGLRSFDRPVYFALGGLSNPDYYDRMSKRLARVFPDFTVEVYPERHHFDPPHRVEPERFAAALKRLWTRAESSQPTI
jgi:pimeloyl-ACP methyl ester carboxylesterase